MFISCPWCGFIGRVFLENVAFHVFELQRVCSRKASASISRRFISQADLPQSHLHVGRIEIPGTAVSLLGCLFDFPLKCRVTGDEGLVLELKRRPPLSFYAFVCSDYCPQTPSFSKHLTSDLNSTSTRIVCQTSQVVLDAVRYLLFSVMACQEH